MTKEANKPHNVLRKFTCGELAKDFKVGDKYEPIKDVDGVYLASIRKLGFVNFADGSGSSAPVDAVTEANEQGGVISMAEFEEGSDPADSESNKDDTDNEDDTDPDDFELGGDATADQENETADTSKQDEIIDQSDLGDTSTESDGAANEQESTETTEETSSEKAPEETATDTSAENTSEDTQSDAPKTAEQALIDIEKVTAKAELKPIAAYFKLNIRGNLGDENFKKELVAGLNGLIAK